MIRTSSRALATGGFTLIEMVVVVAIIAILAAIVMPAYTSAMQKSRRAEGKVLLQTVMAAEERNYANFNRYSADAGASGLNIAAESQPGRFYLLEKISLSDDAQTITLTALPQNAQASDSCGKLTLESTGRRGASGSAVADCW